MNSGEPRKPDFLIIGAPRAGTSWLWEMLKQHPGTDLPRVKEPFFFGSSEIYNKGLDWYYGLFKDIDPSKVTGEGSTSNFYDRVPYFYNKGTELMYDDSLPVIPKLITDELPDIKIFICLRDPVQRAISHYGLFKGKGDFSPFTSLGYVAKTLRKKRLIEYGQYAKYLALWKQYVPPERMCILIFEEDVLKTPADTLRRVYSFLGLDPGFKPQNYRNAVNRTKGWSRVVINYYLGRKARRLTDFWPLRALFDQTDKYEFLKKRTVREEDIEYIRSILLPEKKELESSLGRSLHCWRYGHKL